MKKKDFLSITNLSAKEIWFVLGLAQKMKVELKNNTPNNLLSGKSLVMIFEKPSLRTRLSFEIGIHQLGGHAVYLPPDGIGLGVREKVSDIAKVASSMGDMIMARTYQHTTITELANNSQ